MAIKLYAGIIEEVDGKEQVEKFVPFHIVKPVPVEGWNNGLAYQFKGNIYVNSKKECVCRNFDNENYDLVEVIFQLFDIDRNGSDAQLKGKENITVSIFTDEDINTKTNMCLYIISLYDRANGYALLLFGDITRSILYRFERMRIFTDKKIALVLGPNYNEENLDDLLEAGRIIENSNFSVGNHTSYFHTPDNALFFPVQNNRDNFVSLGGSYTNDFEFANYSCNLICWANWYTMITGKYYYGNPFSIDLLEPVNGIEKIDIGVTMYQNVEFDNGRAEDNEEEGAGQYRTFRYYNVGTDLGYLFPHDSENVDKSIPLKNGFLRKQKIDDNNIIYSIVVNGKGLQFLYQTPYYKVYVMDPLVYTYNDIWVKGAYIFVNNDFAEKSVKQWLEEIPEDFDKYEYGNSPLFLASYTYWYPIKAEYYEYNTNDNLYIPCLCTNFSIDNNNGNYQRIAFPGDLEIDFEFWQTLLSSMIVAPTGPNIGGGSISAGGNGNFDLSSDVILEPSVPQNNLSGSLLTMWWLSSGGSTAYETRINGLSEWLNNLSIFGSFEERAQGIISLKAIYSTNEPGQTSSKKFEIRGSAVFGNEGNCPYLTNQFEKIDLGNFTLEEFFGNFLDFDKTSVKIYLPFSGTYDLNPSLIVGGICNLSCIINYLTGEIVYSIKIQNENLNSVIYTFNGNCGVDLPITYTDYSGKIVSAINTAVGAATTLGMKVSGNLFGGVVNLTNTALNGLNFIKDPGNIKTTGVNSGSLGQLSVRSPFLIIERPIMQASADFGRCFGWKTSVSGTLSRFEGFTVVSEVHLDNIPTATSEEIKEIEALLKEGVIL